MDGSQATPISRRSALRIGAVAAGGAAALAVGAWPGKGAARPRALPPSTPASTAPPPSSPLSVLLDPPPVTASVTPPPVVAAVTRHPRPGRERAVPTPDWARRWTSPIYSTADFHRHCPHEAPLPRDGVMLTIDDGPQGEWTPLYLDLLQRYDVKATFCLIGEQVHALRNLVRRMVAEGHHVANHTWTHPLNLNQLSAAKIRTEIVRTQDMIEKVSGFRPRQFRAPGGNWGQDIFAELAREELMPLGWDIDPRDWARPGTAHIRSAMLDAGPGDIILCHDGGGNRSQTYAALETVVPALRKRGLAFELLPAPQTIVTT